MIPNHKQFIEAIKEKKKVCLQFYSKADSGVIDLVHVRIWERWLSLQLVRRI